MRDWPTDQDQVPDPEIRAEGVIVGVFVVLAYLYGAYLVVTYLLVDWPAAQAAIRAGSNAMGSSIAELILLGLLMATFLFHTGFEA